MSGVAIEMKLWPSTSKSRLAWKRPPGGSSMEKTSGLRLHMRPSPVADWMPSASGAPKTSARASAEMSSGSCASSRQPGTQRAVNPSQISSGGHSSLRSQVGTHWPLGMSHV